ncbi:MAG TPA: hypothetical protein VFJ85_08935 [Acidimicrobiales bacterium]|nr:hypothetical protein [Acidimicrobiales bacterium]
MDQALRAVASDDLSTFTEALWSMAMFGEPDELDEVLDAAAAHAQGDEHWRSIAVAIEAAAASRSVIPARAEAILARIPDGTLASDDRDGAREVIGNVRASGQ